ncbi:ORC-CDC6 family AAA ATPase [Spirosoma gilvum]
MMATPLNTIPLNRAEELGYDLWNSFVIPPYYNMLNLASNRKPIIIVGGRGCGKTMLLRYLCHETQFSEKRSNIKVDDLQNIGIYWRIDTQFAKMLRKRNIDNDIWERAFEHMAVLLISIEILKSLESIGKSSFKLLSTDDINNIDFSILKAFNGDIPSDFSGLKRFLRWQFNSFQAWAGNSSTNVLPTFYLKSFLTELIKEIKDQNKALSDANFLVYIDEYENLLDEQKKLVNTWLKHSEMPLIFNLAMKRNSFQERSTVGYERLSDIHDYREYDLELLYNKTAEFNVFAAEILFLRLSKNGNNDLPINLDHLTSSNKKTIKSRNSEIYKRNVLNYARKLFPSISPSELAKEVFKDSTLKERLRTIIKSGLESRRTTLTELDFILPDYPEASIVTASLLNRKNLKVSEIHNELINYINGVPNKFNGQTDWIHNNLIGCILLIYEPLGRVCPIYAGFDSFCQMSNTNLRHFLELCNKSIVNEIWDTGKEITDLESISIKQQSEAAKQASIGFLKEVKSFGNTGNILHSFTMRLGTYYRLVQKRNSQSEPEQNHFIVKDTISEDVQKFLDEAVKWSVLYENRSTKHKHSEETVAFEYILNPIYSPYFHISYRKKKRSELTNRELEIFISGEVDLYEGILKYYLKSWSMHSPDSGTLSLFSQDSF